MEDFQYLPLDSKADSFRLIKLLRGDTIEIQCEIFHASIFGEDAVCYEALSYTWGYTELVEVIELNSKRLRITENLHSALQCLRYKDKDRVLWVDGICIDQENPEERSRQVQRMGNIFRSATNVIFWLGKPTAEIELLFTSLRELDDQRHELAILDNQSSDTTQLMNLWSDIYQKQQFKTKNSEFKMQKGFVQLLKRPWFQRVWILQEVANSQSAILCCGKLTVPADVFSLGPLLLSTQVDDHSQSILDIMPGPERISSWWSNEDQRKLIYLHSKFAASKATDARDAIFALLGMSSEPQDHRLLRVDYTKSLQQVVMSTIRYWLQVTSLPILKVLDAANCFGAVRTTYLCFATGYNGPDEVQVPINLVNPALEYVECTRDPHRLLIEPYQGQNGNGVFACYRELDRPELWRDGSDERGEFQYNTKYADAFRIAPWRVGNDNVRMLIIANEQEALIRIALNEWRQAFNLLARHIFWKKKRQIGATLVRVAKQGSPEAVRIVLDQGVNVNHDASRFCSDSTALIGASRKGNLPVVKLLLKYGADVNRTTWNGPCSALIGASKGGYLEVVDTLLQHGAGAIINYCRGRWPEASALVAASYYGHPPVVRLLLEHGADFNLLPGKGANRSLQQYFCTPLMAACLADNMDIVDMLLDHGADVNAVSEEHGNALEIASRRYDTEMVLKLIENGADVNARTKSRYGTAVAAARESYRYEILKVLAEHGAIIDSDSKRDVAYWGPTEALSASDENLSFK